jgi:maltose alpha-D-glucosyltransferase/alpha-amylase
MRLNVGIRRRLASLMDNGRRRIELLHGLLFSLPGSPFIYYGDEIGMGDNIYLGDRDGVRTPMQWSSDRNAGFSKADLEKLYFPVISNPVYGYQAVNVEAQQRYQSSLLQWMRLMIHLRKSHRVFGRGNMEFIRPENRKIFAFTRTYEDETVLCVFNLSRVAQPVELDLAYLRGKIPVEMAGGTEFPTITESPYQLALAPYGFYWFLLQESQV